MPHPATARCCLVTSTPKFGPQFGNRSLNDTRHNSRDNPRVSRCSTFSAPPCLTSFRSRNDQTLHLRSPTLFPRSFSVTSGCRSSKSPMVSLHPFPPGSLHPLMTHLSIAFSSSPQSNSSSTIVLIRAESL